MLKHFAIFIFAFCLSHARSFSQGTVTVASPDKNIAFAFKLLNKAPSYSVLYKNKLLIESSTLSLSFSNERPFKDNVTMKKAMFRDGREKYELVVGKAGPVDDAFREVTIPLVENEAPKRAVDLVVRAFNGGLAFRYVFHEGNGRNDMVLTDEGTSFKPAGDPLLRVLLLPNYTTSHEGEYTITPFSRLKEDTLIDMPALLEFPGPVYMGITEANLVNYAGMYLSKKGNTLLGKLSPLPGQNDIKVKATLPHQSPWRVMLISDRIGSLIESNIITDLNEPCAVTDLSWIKPGKSTWMWWNGNVTPDTSWAPGNNFETNKYYIDFCARNNIEYHSVIEYGLHEWYINDGDGFSPGPHVDVTRTVPGLDMKQICDYAKQHGVDIRVWVHWAALYPKLDSAFAKFESWGIKGMMIDFMDRDDQEMVNIQIEMLQKAAKHHLHIQFHGAYKPTGLHRTYPNEFTREGTLNYEVNKWDKRVTPDHDLNIAFVRMLAGATDYHLGGFRAVPEKDFRVQYTRPLMMGTRCHMLAMYVVLESYLALVSDYPAAYEGQPGFDFIREVPTVWEETKVLAARPGEYLVIARKKNNVWYVGAINNHEARSLEISFDFLNEGNYTAVSYADAPNVAAQPNNLVSEKSTISKNDRRTINLAAGGGWAMQAKQQ